MALIGPGLIEKIDLSNNRLTTLKSNIFSYLTNLRYILLNNNLLKHIEKDAFVGVNFLVSLDLGLNKLSDHDLTFLSHANFSKLRHLKLSHNHLTYIKASQFVCMGSLSTLDLSSNQISHLSDCAFHGLQATIKKLLLNYNLLTRINSCAFSLEFNNLRFVEVIHNPINCSNNCEFFFTVYKPPYSIDYKGIECIDASFNNQKIPVCSQFHYEHIHRRCQKRLLNNNCLLKELRGKVDCEGGQQSLKNETHLNETSRSIKNVNLYEESDDYYADQPVVSGVSQTIPNIFIFLVFFKLFQFQRMHIV